MMIPIYLKQLYYPLFLKKLEKLEIQEFRKFKKTAYDDLNKHVLSDNDDTYLSEAIILTIFKET